MQCIILAGGFGTRLKSKIKNIPKPMADVNGRPFLDYVFNFLKRYRFTKIIISTYYKSSVIEEAYGDRVFNIPIVYSIDKNPLGSGGAIKVALNYVNDDNVIILNGDTFFDVDLKSLMTWQNSNNNDITLSLKEMKDFDRYGYVSTNARGHILSFNEKKYQSSGTIDGGVYIIKRKLFEKTKIENCFNFSDFIRNNLYRLKIGSLTFNNTFIDIGTPEDLFLAKSLLKTIN